ncbi:MAG: DUF4397 domain-containing protein [Saprospirales bacterium]|nr:DUF4397 domain-containing protein [Saprospirales bacterium]
MKQLLTLCVLMCLAIFAEAQTARVQIIHNSPTPGTMSGPVVDIYVNGALLPPLTAVPFRAATPFLDVPAGVGLTVEVKLNPSTPADPAAATFPIGSLADGGTYVVTAAGVVGDMDTPFNLYVNAQAQEAAADPGKVDLAVFHGSPDAPAVDVDARTVGNLIGQLAFGSYVGYLPVDEGLYYLDVRAAGDPNIVATFAADLNGLAGGAATVFASGLLGDTPAFGLFAALPNGAVVELPASPVARLQVIHNSPSPTVDIYVNGNIFLPGVAFRTASPFGFVPAETALDLSIVPAGGDPVTDNVYTGGPLTLTNGQTYVVVADGIAGNPDYPFNLDILADAREAGSSMDNVDFVLLHGSPGAPPVDVEAFGVVTGTLASNLAYGDFSSYVSAPDAPYFITISVPSLGAEIPFYVNLEGLAGGAATVFASGLVGGTPGFGIFAALSDGTIVEFPQITEYANVNIIHNSPSPGAAVVDVYLNGGLAVDDFEFRTATGFIEIPAGLPISIDVAPASSSSVGESIANFDFPAGLESAQNYIITAGGLVGDATYPFGLQILADAKQEAATAGNVEVVVLHSSPGAPAVDVDARTIGNLIENLAYGEYSDGYLDVPAAQYYLDIRANGSPDIVATFSAPLDLFEDAALTVFASGILGGSPAFGLFAAAADGTVVELDAVEISRTQIIHNAPSPTVDIYLNGDLAVPALAFREATPFVFTPANSDVQVTIVPQGGDPVTDAVFDAPVTFGQNGETQIVIATGIVGDATTPFGLNVFSGGREATATGVDLLLYHGSTDAPEVDVVVGGGGPILFDNIAYGNFSDAYVNVPADAYVLDITPANDNNQVVVSFEADISGLDGGAAVVFASGFFSGDEPEFGVWVALPDGTTFPLSVVLSTTDLPELNGWNLVPNPVAPGITSTLQVDLAAQQWASIRVLDAMGKQVQAVFQGQLMGGQTAFDLDTANLVNGMYFVQLQTQNGSAVQKLVVNR